MSNKSIIITGIALALASCSQNEEPSILLEPNSASFSARIGQIASRASGTEWDAGDAIGISGVSGSKTYSNVKFVTLSGDGNFSDAGNNIYYQTTDPVTFTTYYPYADALGAEGIINASTTDQYQQPTFDFLWAQASGNYAAPTVNFTFAHRMSKINIAFTNGNDVDLNGLTFSIEGLVLDGTFDTATGEAKAVENGSTVPLTATLTADSKASLIVFPQSADNLTITATAEGQQYSCTLSPGSLTAGNAYTINISIKKTGMTITGCTITPWGDGGNIDGEATLMTPKVGDYYYSDGSYSTVYDASKNAIGIIFYVGHHPEDDSDYSASGIGQQKCHGYAVAMTDATSSECMWGVDGTEVGCYPTDANGNKQNNLDNPDIDWSGYAWTHRIITAAGGKDKLNATEEAGYPATWYAVMSYETGCNAPAKSSGWFLPSIGQLWEIYQNRSSLFDSVSEAEGLKSEWYCSSSERYNDPARYPICVYWLDGYVGHNLKYVRYNYVRPILAF